MLLRNPCLALGAGLCVVLGALWAPVPTSAGGWRNPFAKTTSVQRLAERVDLLERHIDTYGSVVAKAPDVWGEARLTMHRQEYEEQLKTQLTQFEANINGAISRSDQAFLAQSFALQAAVTRGRSAPVAPPAVSSTPPALVTTKQTTISKSIVDGVDKQVTTEEGLPTPAPAAAPAPGPTIPQPPSGSLITTEMTFDAAPPQGATFSTKEISLEPTIHLDQMSRYLQHLQELRRVNEGDDTSDSPGYSLNLVRIPISVLPGKKTRQGYGAEVTITAEPWLGDALLPMTVKNLVSNDIIDELALPLTRLLSDVREEDKVALLDFFDAAHRATELIAGKAAELPKPLPELNYFDIHEVKRSTGVAYVAIFRDWLERYEGDVFEADFAAMKLPVPAVSSRQPMRDERISKASVPRASRSGTYRLVAQVQTEDSMPPTTPRPMQSELELNYERLKQNFNPQMRVQQRVQEAENKPLGTQSMTKGSDQKSPIRTYSTQSYGKMSEAAAQEVLATVVKRADQVNEESERVVERLVDTVTPSFAPSRTRNATMPFATSQLRSVLGMHAFGHLVQALRSGFANDPVNGDTVLLMDVRNYLSEEVAQAYEFLESPDQMHLWDSCSRELYLAVRSQDSKRIAALRNSFNIALTHEAVHTPTAGLAWLIMVNAALLNQRLIDDINAVATHKNCPFACVDGWVPFYLPDPKGCDTRTCNTDAKELFKQYVRCRWPIHVFALDPVTQDQNIADSFSRKRELQLALSLAFASGRMGAQSFTRFSRRIETDIDTIALNRTVVGFSHGEDTFGWRFYPRLQTPDIESNFTVITRDLLIGGPTRDQELCKMRLEPGPRECTAIVLMPSFVPYVLFDFRTNWFRLNNPKNKEFTLRDGVDLSRQIQELHTLSEACVKDQDLYREGEVHRVMRSVDQLERRLPTQTSWVQVPYENTLGGFEMFNSGVTDLAPELKGFYGEPGIDVTPGALTELFVVGDHFSVHQTVVVSGNSTDGGVLGQDPVVNYQLLSRQVMKVTIRNARPLKNGRFVDIHVATPYGVSNHLLVPVANGPADAKAALEAAIEKHRTQDHVTRFQWSTRPAMDGPYTGEIRFDGLHACDFKFTAPSKAARFVVSDASISPSTRRPRTQPATLTMKLTFLTADETPVGRAQSVGPRDVTLDAAEILPVLEGELLKGIQAGMNRTHNVRFIKVEPFISFPLNHTPEFRIAPNELFIEVTPVEVTADCPGEICPPAKKPEPPPLPAGEAVPPMIRPGTDSTSLPVPTGVKPVGLQKPMGAKRLPREVPRLLAP